MKFIFCDIPQWESKVMRGQEEFDNISRMIKKEVELLEQIRVKEFKDTVIKYLEDHMAHQQQVSYSIVFCYHFLYILSKYWF